MLVVAFFSVVACSREQKTQGVVATVNDAPILLKDLQEESFDTGRRKHKGGITQSELKARLGTLIDKKLMAQEAVRLGIDKDERFRHKMEALKERALIDEIIIAKTDEWKQTLTVSDEEVKALYSRMRYKVYIKEAHAADRTKAALLLRLMRGNKRVKGMKTRGPLYAERVAMTDPLYQVFDMKTGEGVIWAEPDGYRVVVVARKRPLALPSFKSVAVETKNYIFEKKKRAVMDAWLASLKKASRIEVRPEEIEKIKEGILMK